MSGALQHRGAVAPGPVAPDRPPNEEATGVTAGGSERKEKVAIADCANFGTARQLVEQMRDALDKRVSTARARLAMQGFECHIVLGGFMVGRWGATREIESLDELEHFVELVCGGRS